jgi:hypothetical protein
MHGMLWTRVLRWPLSVTFIFERRTMDFVCDNLLHHDEHLYQNIFNPSQNELDTTPTNKF